MWERPQRSDELYHYGRKGMKWYQHIFGPVQSGAKYSKGKSEEKKLDKNSEEYYRNKVRNGQRLTFEDENYYLTNVYKTPDYSSIKDKTEKAKKECAWLKSRSDAASIEDIDPTKKYDPIKALEGQGMFNHVNRIASKFFDNDKNSNQQIVNAIEKMYDMRRENDDVWATTGWDFKTRTYANPKAYEQWKKRNEAYKKHKSSIDGMYLKELGFENTLENRDAIRPYWDFDA